MLEQILDFIHNYFIKEVYRGKFKISNGSLLDIDFLQEGQYFKIVGSIFNDGVHKYLSADASLIDEEFVGDIWAMAVPPAVIALADEITDWVDKYGDIMNSPYQSESFGGYSYSKAQGYASAGGEILSSWQAVFGSRLNHWRKIA